MRSDGPDDDGILTQTEQLTQPSVCDQFLHEKTFPPNVCFEFLDSLGALLGSHCGQLTV